MGVPAEYLAGVRELVTSGHLDGQWMQTFEEQVRGLYDQMAQITITPKWAKVLDFETRIPSAVESIVREKFGAQ